MPTRILNAWLSLLGARMSETERSRWHARLGLTLFSMLALGQLSITILTLATRPLDLAALAVLTELGVCVGVLLFIRWTGRWRSALLVGWVFTLAYLGALLPLEDSEISAIAMSIAIWQLITTSTFGKGAAWPSFGLALSAWLLGLIGRYGLEELDAPSVFGVGVAMVIAAALAQYLESARARAFVRIAEQAAAEERARGAEAQANARSAFLATMSHEIRTPMNGVLNLTRLLSETDLDADQRHLVDVNMQSGRTLMALLDDILDLSKLDAGRMTLEEHPVAVRTLLGGVAALMQGRADEEGLELVVEVGAEVPPWSRGDPVRLRQILTNLVSNSIKFTAEGRVTLRALTQGDHLVLEVEDTGIGIPHEAQVHLFEPFTQADPTITRKFGGTGLGLAICRRLAEAMHGSITVTSVVGEGSRFSVQLPLSPCDAPTQAPPEAFDESLGGLRVLVAEDNPVNQLVISRLLDRLEVEVTVVDDGAAALEALQTRLFDVVLMDVQMPGMDGLEAAARIRALDGPVARIPVVALTASATADDRARCLASGMDDFLAKPVDPDALQRVIRSRVVPPARSEVRDGAAEA